MSSFELEPRVVASNWTLQMIRLVVTTGYWSRDGTLIWSVKVDQFNSNRSSVVSPVYFSVFLILKVMRLIWPSLTSSRDPGLRSKDQIRIKINQITLSKIYYSQYTGKWKLVRAKIMWGDLQTLREILLKFKDMSKGYSCQILNWSQGLWLLNELSRWYVL